MDLRHLPNGGNELRRDAQLHANKIHHLLTASLRLYDQEGSSSRIKLWELQYRFSNIIAFTDPFFLPRFSNFALSARELDIQNGRVDFNIGGLIPHPEICVKQTLQLCYLEAHFATSDHAVSHHKGQIHQAKFLRLSHHALKIPQHLETAHPHQKGSLSSALQVWR